MSSQVTSSLLGLPLWAVSYGPHEDEVKLVRAPDQEEAVETIKSRCASVGAYKSGLIFCVWRLGNYPEKFHVAYDGEPLTESHGATNAKLVTKALGRSHV